MGRPRKRRTLADFVGRTSFTPTEFAELTDVPRRTVYRLIDRQFLRTIPGTHRIPRPVVEQALAVDMKEA